MRAKLAQVLSLFSARTDASLVIFGVACEECDGEVAVGGLVKNTLPVIVSQIDRHFYDTFTSSHE